mmetsp:Transcript_27284/g.73738  ORF Transcript_27284/g.73738 Transcript_27284/m.73738 type:complete len:408 (+) Transcript_27284:506-1729(+)
MGLYGHAAAGGGPGRQVRRQACACRRHSLVFGGLAAAACRPFSSSGGLRAGTACDAHGALLCGLGGRRGPAIHEQPGGHLCAQGGQVQGFGNVLFGVSHGQLVRARPITPHSDSLWLACTLLCVWLFRPSPPRDVAVGRPRYQAHPQEHSCSRPKQQQQQLFQWPCAASKQHSRSWQGRHVHGEWAECGKERGWGEHIRGSCNRECEHRVADEQAGDLGHRHRQRRQPFWLLHLPELDAHLLCQGPWVRPPCFQLHGLPAVAGHGCGQLAVGGAGRCTCGQGDPCHPSAQSCANRRVSCACCGTPGALATWAISTASCGADDCGFGHNIPGPGRLCCQHVGHCPASGGEDVWAVQHLWFAVRDRRCHSCGFHSRSHQLVQSCVPANSRAIRAGYARVVAARHRGAGV